MFLHQDDYTANTQYPLALGKIISEGGSEIPSNPPAPVGTARNIPVQALPVTGVSPEISRLSVRAEDLYSFGAISATQRARIGILLQSGQPLDADAIISDAERKFQNKKPSFSIVKQIDYVLPEGFKIQQFLIPNVPNYMLYGGVVVGLIVLRQMFKRKS